MAFSSSRRYVGCLIETVTCIAVYKTSHVVFRGDVADSKLISTASWFSTSNIQSQKNPMVPIYQLLHTFAPPSIYWALGPVISGVIGGRSRVQISASSIAANLMGKPNVLVASGIFLGINFTLSVYKGLSNATSPGNFVMFDNTLDAGNFFSRVALNPLRDSLLFHSLLFTRVLVLQGPIMAFVCSSFAYAISTTTSDAESRATLAGYNGLTAGLVNFIDSLFLQCTYFFTGGRAFFTVMSNSISSVQSLQRELNMSRDILFYEYLSSWRNFLQGINVQLMLATGSSRSDAVTTLSPIDKEKLTTLCEKIACAFSTSNVETLSPLDLGDAMYAVRCVLSKTINPTGKSRSKHPTDLSEYASSAVDPSIPYSIQQSLLDIMAVFASDESYALAIALFAKDGLAEINATDLTAIVANELVHEKVPVADFLTQWSQSGMDDTLALLIAGRTATGRGVDEESDGADSWDWRADLPMKESDAWDMVDAYYHAMFNAMRYQIERFEAVSKATHADISRDGNADGFDHATINRGILGDKSILDFVVEGPSGLPPAYIEATMNQPIVLDADRKKLLAAAACRRAGIRQLNVYGFTIRSFRRVVARLSKVYPSVEELDDAWKDRINKSEMRVD